MSDWPPSWTDPPGSDRHAGGLRRFIDWAKFAAAMFLPPLVVVLAVVAAFTAPLWWNYVFGWLR